MSTYTAVSSGGSVTIFWGGKPLYSVLHEPVVSIVIINWNYGRFVADAIQSVKEQTYKNIECVVVDNGSTDGSSEIIKEAIGSNPKFTFVQLERILDI